MLDAANPLSEKNLQLVLPSRIIVMKSKQQWVEAIQAELTKLKAVSAGRAEVLFLDKAREVPNYGMSFFSAKVNFYLYFSSNICAVSRALEQQ